LQLRPLIREAPGVLQILGSQRLWVSSVELAHYPSKWSPPFPIKTFSCGGIPHCCALRKTALQSRTRKPHEWSLDIFRAENAVDPHPSLRATLSRQERESNKWGLWLKRRFIMPAVVTVS